VDECKPLLVTTSGPIQTTLHGIDVNGTTPDFQGSQTIFLRKDTRSTGGSS